MQRQETLEDAGRIAARDRRQEVRERLRRVIVGRIGDRAHERERHVVFRAHLRDRRAFHFDRERVRSGGRLNVGKAIQWLADRKPLPTNFVQVTPPLNVTYASRTTEGWDGYGASSAGSISADGRYVAFLSTGTNMVPGDVNNVADVFLRAFRP